jgi:hypothetical protein
MPDYQNGKIYSIRSYQTELIYIGSTTQSLSKRLGKHRENYKKNGEVSSKELLKYSDYYIELIENFPCNSREELEKQEGYYIRKNINICVNCLIAGRTKKEYAQDNVEKFKEYNKKYHEDNKERIREQKKKYREDNLEKIKEHKKQYAENNKEHIKEYQNQYYLNNKEIQKQKAKEYYQKNKEIQKQKAKEYREKLKQQNKIITDTQN